MLIEHPSMTFYRYSPWGLQWGSNLSKVKHQVSDKLMGQTGHFLLKPTIFIKQMRYSARDEENKGIWTKKGSRPETI